CPLSLHDALPICRLGGGVFLGAGRRRRRLGRARLLRAAAATRRQQQGQRCQQRPPSLASHLSPPSFRESRRGAQLAGPSELSDNWAWRVASCTMALATEARPRSATRSTI